MFSRLAELTHDELIDTGAISHHSTPEVPVDDKTDGGRAAEPQDQPNEPCVGFIGQF